MDRVCEKQDLYDVLIELQNMDYSLDTDIVSIDNNDTTRRQPVMGTEYR